MNLSRPIASLPLLMGLAIVLTLAAMWLLALAQSTPLLGMVLQADAASGKVVIVSTSGPTAAIKTPAQLLAVGSVDREQRLALNVGDLAAVPGKTASLEAGWLARQEMVSQWLKQPELTLLVAHDGVPATYLIRPVERAANTMPSHYWAYIWSGAAVALLAAWAWAAHPRSPAAVALALAGLSYPVLAYTAALGSSRELAMPAAYLLRMGLLHNGAALVFGFALLSLLLLYPTRLLAHRVFWAVPVLGMASLIATGTGALSSARLHAGLQGLMLAAIALLLLQLSRSRTNPWARASLRAVLLAVCLGGMVLMLFADDAASEAVLLQAGVVLVFAALAVGVQRHLLYRFDVWCWHLLGAVIALGVAATVYAGLHPAIGTAMAMVPALLAGGLAIFGFRRLRATLHQRHRLDQQAMLGKLAELIREPDRAVRTAGWQAALQRAFAARQVSEPGRMPLRTTVVDAGATLILPPLLNLPAARIEQPWQGNVLLSPTHAKQVDQWLRALARAMDTLPVAADAERETDQPRTLLPLTAVLAELTQQARTSATAAGVDLQIDVATVPEQTLLDDYRAERLQQVVKELLTNSARHANARQWRLQIDVSDAQLHLQFADDGCGFDADTRKPGQGLAHLARWVAEAGGRYRLQATRSGVSCDLTLPLTTD
ncbi:ATP-binding protein [Chitinimonas sp. BJYL2]|uniref:ATP-binding protein n=1 Tax=Chitinimonas sp. BJYL2 TaxID=2976696 RepID=UPI0022B4D75A|nr:ATP-binding protein [Chitinimonas sp. BJYL2]